MRESKRLGSHCDRIEVFQGYSIFSEQDRTKTGKTTRKVKEMRWRRMPTETRGKCLFPRLPRGQAHDRLMSFLNCSIPHLFPLLHLPSPHQIRLQFSPPLAPSTLTTLKPLIYTTLTYLYSITSSECSKMLLACATRSPSEVPSRPAPDPRLPRSPPHRHRIQAPLP